MSPKVMRTPRSLDLEITSRCNASCRYCYYLNNPEVVYTDLPTDAWLDAFTEFARCQVMNVTLMGGEPLLREDFTILVDGIVANRMRFGVLSNGSCLDDKIAAHLKQSGRCDYVQVSLDGSTAAAHESLRGRGTFEPALSAIKLLQEYDVPVTVRVTVHPGNLEDLPALTSLLLDELKLPSFSTNAASSLGSSAKYDAATFLSPGERLQAMRTLAVLDAEYPGRIQADAGPLAEWHMFNDMENARRRAEPIAGRGRLVGCGCVFDSLAVRSDGAYVPCVMLPQMILGRVGADHLEQVWQNSAELNRMRERNQVPLEAFEECQGCIWLENCTGNCPGLAYTATGQIDRPCPEACLRRFQEQLAQEGEALWS